MNWLRIAQLNHNLFSKYKHQYPINFHSRMKTYATSYSRKDIYYIHSLETFGNQTFVRWSLKNIFKRF